MEFKFSGDEGRKLAKHVQEGGSLGDIFIPILPDSVKNAEVSMPLAVDSKGSMGPGLSDSKPVDKPGCRPLPGRRSV